MLKLHNSSVLPVELGLFCIKPSQWCDQIESNCTSCTNCTRVEMHWILTISLWLALFVGGDQWRREGPGWSAQLHSWSPVARDGRRGCWWWWQLQRFFVLLLWAARASVCHLKSSLSSSLLLDFDGLHISGAGILQNGEHMNKKEIWNIISVTHCGLVTASILMGINSDNGFLISATKPLPEPMRPNDNILRPFPQELLKIQLHPQDPKTKVVVLKKSSVSDNNS